MQVVVTAVQVVAKCRGYRFDGSCALVGQLTRQCSPLAPQTLQA